MAAPLHTVCQSLADGDLEHKPSRQVFPYCIQSTASTTEPVVGHPSEGPRAARPDRPPGARSPDRSTLPLRGHSVPGAALRYDVNLSILFTELPLLERPAAAAAAGFAAV